MCARKSRKRAERRELETIVEAEGIVDGQKADDQVKDPNSGLDPLKPKPKRVRRPEPSENTVFLPDGSWRKKLTERDVEAVKLFAQPNQSLATVAKALGYPNRYAVQSVVRRYHAAEEEGILEHVVP